MTILNEYEQIVPARDVLAACDTSCDLGDEFSEFELIDWKLDECDKGFVRSIKRYGVKVPVVVVIHESGTWEFGNGHHRLAVAVKHDLEIPVLFLEATAEDSSYAWMHRKSSSARYIGSDGIRSPD